MKTEKAFAFLELLVDLALIVILIGLIVPYHNNTKKKIGLRIARREIRMLKIAVISYYENQNPHAYPSVTNNLCADYLINAKPRIIEGILYDYFSKKKQEYRYSLSPNGKYFCIWAVGVNEKSDIQGIDDNSNVIQERKCDDLYATPTVDPA